MVEFTTSKQVKLMMKSYITAFVLLCLTYSLTANAQSGSVDFIYLSRDIDVKPEFIGGEDSLAAFIGRNLHYDSVKQAGVAGRVIVGFVVNRDGSLTEIKINYPLDPALDREALRVVSMMPSWKPGELKANAVRSRTWISLAFGSAAQLAKRDYDMVHQFVEEQPAFTGGTDAMHAFIKDELKLPPRPKGYTTLRVFVQFIVNRDGSLSDIIALKPNIHAADAEAIRVCSAMPPWRPGRQNGKLVRVKFVLPIEFNWH